MILFLTAVLAIVVGIIYWAEPAKSVPSFVIGVIFAVGAWFDLAYKPAPPVPPDRFSR